MPIYVYECPCGFRSERIEMTPDPYPPECARCADQDRRVEMVKVPAVSSFELKGTGWYRQPTKAYIGRGD